MGERQCCCAIHTMQTVRSHDFPDLAETGKTLEGIQANGQVQSMPDSDTPSGTIVSLRGSLRNPTLLSCPYKFVCKYVKLAMTVFYMTVGQEKGHCCRVMILILT